MSAEQQARPPAPAKGGGIFPVVRTICAFVLLAEVIAVAFLFMTGTVTTDKVVRAFKLMVAKEEEPKAVEEKIEGPFASVTTSLELADAVKKAQQDFETREAKLRKREVELKQLKAEFARFQDEVKKDRAALQKMRAQFEADLKAYIDRTKSQGFEEAVAIYQKMSPVDVATILLAKPEQDMMEVVELMRAFKSSFVAEVLTEMKRIEEEKAVTGGQTRAARILALIRSGEPKVALPVAAGGTTQ